MRNSQSKNSRYLVADAHAANPVDPFLIKICGFGGPGPVPLDPDRISGHFGGLKCLMIFETPSSFWRSEDVFGGTLGSQGADIDFELPGVIFGSSKADAFGTKMHKKCSKISSDRREVHTLNFAPSLWR